MVGRADGGRRETYKILPGRPYIRREEGSHGLLALGLSNHKRRTSHPPLVETAVAPDRPAVAIAFFLVVAPDAGCVAEPFTTKGRWVRGRADPFFGDTANAERPVSVVKGRARW